MRMKGSRKVKTPLPGTSFIDPLQISFNETDKISLNSELETSVLVINCKASLGQPMVNLVYNLQQIRAHLLYCVKGWTANTRAENSSRFNARAIVGVFIAGLAG